MINLIMRLLGSRVAHKAMAQHIEGGGLLDAKFGFALLRDRRVPLLSKLLALGVGFALMYTLVALELPFEAALALLLPIIGVGVDAMIDGAEMIAGPALFACLLLPHLAPRPVIAQIRAERAGLGSGPVIDVTATEPQPARPQPTTDTRHMGFMGR